MRLYGSIPTNFWSSETGKKIRRSGSESLVTACYLLTCPSSTMTGLYYLPLPTLCHEIGCSIEGARKALASLSEAHFAYYDEASEYVWVPCMAEFQIGDSLKPGDKRISGLVKMLRNLKTSPYYDNFLALYRDRFHLGELSPTEATSKPLPGPFDAPSKPESEAEAGAEQNQTVEKSPAFVEAEPSTKKLSKAERLKLLEAFQVTDEIRDWARKEFVVEIPDDVVEGFKAYWRIQTKLRVDWPATFKERIRDVHKKLPLSKVNGVVMPLIPPQKKCAGMNGEPCQDYVVPPSNTFCTKHKAANDERLAKMIGSNGHGGTVLPANIMEAQS